MHSQLKARVNLYTCAPLWPYSWALWWVCQSSWQTGGQAERWPWILGSALEEWCPLLAPHWTHSTHCSSESLHKSENTLLGQYERIELLEHITLLFFLSKYSDIYSIITVSYVFVCQWDYAKTASFNLWNCGNLNYWAVWCTLVLSYTILLVGNTVLKFRSSLVVCVVKYYKNVYVSSEIRTKC